MIKYCEGTVFNVNASALVNTVNCVGVMGAGIALEFMLRYPEMFDDYEDKCNAKKILTGKVDYYKNKDGTIIINFPTKTHYKYPSKLLWIETGLQHFVNTYSEFGIKSVAFPKLGTSNGGLDWNDVKLLMEKYLSKLDIDIYICLDTLGEAEGIEKKMLDKFNSTDITDISKVVKLNIKQKENLQMQMPYDRFWEISDTESIGKKTYSNIFKYFYKIAIGRNEEPSQISLYDL